MGKKPQNTTTKPRASGPVPMPCFQEETMLLWRVEWPPGNMPGSPAQRRGLSSAPFPLKWTLGIEPQGKFCPHWTVPRAGGAAWASELLSSCIEGGRGAQRRRPGSQQRYDQAHPTILMVHFLCVCSFIHSAWTFRTVSAFVGFLSWWNIAQVRCW